MSAPAARDVVLRHYAAFNAHDLEAYADTLAEDVATTIESGTLLGREAVVAYAAGVFEALPGLGVDVQRIVAEGEDTVVIELAIRLDGPAALRPALEQPLLEELEAPALTYQIHWVRDGRIFRQRSRYGAHPAEHGLGAEVPTLQYGARLIEERQAIRRVAALVVDGLPDGDGLGLVTREMTGLADGACAVLLRADDDEQVVTVVAVEDQAGGDLPPGWRRPLDDRLRQLRAAQSTTPVDPGDAPRLGPLTDLEGELGCLASVTVPIRVRDRLWGFGFVGWRDARPVAEGVRTRLESFLEVAATVLADVQARSEIQRLADEQSALRRVAEVAARGAPAEDVFLAVSREASGLLGTTSTVVCRFEPDGTPIVVADDGGLFAVGTAGANTGGTLAEKVQRTGAPARNDDYASVPGGRPIRDAGVRAAAAAPITVDGHVWGMLVANSLDGPLPARTEQRLAEFSKVVASAVSNAANRDELIASRRRVIASADEARRRLQRDVHDGAQQRLAQSVIVLSMLSERLAEEEPSSEVARMVDEALEHAERGTEALRDIVQGILPASLSSGGLKAAFETLASEHPIAVDTRVDPGRLPADVETTAYFIVAEALTNIVKHARATRVEIVAAIDDDELRLTVRDDGVGGADPARGSGLTGLRDRVAAADGTMRIASPSGAGTTLDVVLPTGSLAG